MSSPSPLRTSLTRLPGLAEVRLGRARLSVVPRLRSSAPRIPFVTLVSVLLVGGVVGLLLFNTSMQQASFQAEALQRQADTLTAQQQALQSQVDSLDDPQRIAARATKMGMVIAPACTATVDLDTARVTGTCPAATRADALPIDPPPVGPPPSTVSTGSTVSPPVPSDPIGTTGEKSGQQAKHDGQKSKHDGQKSQHDGQKNAKTTTGQRSGQQSGQHRHR